MNTLKREDIIEQYFDKFGTGQKSMAASPQSIRYCANLIRENGISSILDCGSGLSSALFHFQFKNVVTVDDDSFWAKMTQDFVKIVVGKEISISTLSNMMNEKFDFIFYDYGDIETRIYYFKLVIFMTKKFIYLDDMHISYYYDYVTHILKNISHELIICTEDEFGRYGALVKIG
ncbi:hypothetical protein [Pedobacter sp. R-06]|uniref:hypothetical protein n=1 Tax=Pedobacter sp. R-06 TaxID=3404051 RepID=UPI003CF50FB7